MPQEILVVEKCCFIIPKRRGLLAFGYINMVVNILITGLFIEFVCEFGKEYVSIYLVAYGILSIMSIIFSWILICGSHKRNPELLILFFRYKAVGIVIGIILDLMTLHEIELLVHIPWIIFIYILLLNSFYIYLMVIVRSSYLKMELNYPVGYTAQPDF